MTVLLIATTNLNKLREYGAIFAGLIYPIAVCAMTVVVGGLFIHETRGHKIDTPIR